MILPVHACYMYTIYFWGKINASYYETLSFQENLKACYQHFDVYFDKIWYIK